MEIRIAHIDRELLEQVREDAKKNMRTIGRQALFIIQAYYKTKDQVLDENVGGKSSSKHISTKPARGQSYEGDSGWRFEDTDR